MQRIKVTNENAVRILPLPRSPRAIGVRSNGRLGLTNSTSSEASLLIRATTVSPGTKGRWTTLLPEYLPDEWVGSVQGRSVPMVKFFDVDSRFEVGNG